MLMIIFPICSMLTNHKSLSNKTAALKDAAEKSANLLAVQTKRFVEFCVRKEDEVKRAKARAESRILLLEKQHGIAISKVNAEKYRYERDSEIPECY